MRVTIRRLLVLTLFGFLLGWFAALGCSSSNGLGSADGTADVSTDPADVALDSGTDAAFPVDLDLGDALTPSDETDPRDLAAPDVDGGSLDADSSGLSGPTLYPVDRVHSPITESVKANLRAIFLAGQQKGQRAYVFAKLGASFEDDVNTFAGCFTPEKMNLDSYSALSGTVDYFSQPIGPEAPGESSWTRDSVAAISGWAAVDGLKVTNGKSAIETELDALKPAFALVAYNGNDIGKSSITAYRANIETIIELCLARGIIPILRTKPREETTSTTRPQKIIEYNAVLRGLAQQYQLPLLDLNLAVKDVVGALGGDNLHLSSYTGKNCWLTAEALTFGKPIYNLIFLQALDRLRRMVVLDEPAEDQTLSIVGAGTHGDPYRIDLGQFPQYRNLPQSTSQDVLVFTAVHHADTSTSSESQFDQYPGCGTQNESGPEVVYRVVVPTGSNGEPLSGKLTLRVFENNTTVDVDPHWLSSLSGDSCLARDDEWFALPGTSSGTYYFVLDTFVGSSGSKPGAAMFSIIFEPGF